MRKITTVATVNFITNIAIDIHNVEGDIGVCGIGQFFMRYFGNFNLELLYCGILQTCGTRFLGVLVDDTWYEKRILHIFRPFLAVSGRFGSNLKQRYFLAHFK